MMMNRTFVIKFYFLFILILASQSYAAPCMEGTFSATGESPCTLCPAGTFINEQGATECTPCPAGSYSDMEGQSECIECSIGRYQPDTGASSCYQCSPGSYAAITGQLTCEKCPADYFQASSEAMGCIICDPGTSSLPGANACVESLNSSACQAGRYESGMSCLDCPLGTYAEAGDGFCRVCEAGTFSAFTQSATCQACPVAFSSNFAIGRTDCRRCDEGSFAQTEGMPGCELCAVGTYADTVESWSCTLCAPNTFSDMLGAISCEPCAEGYIAMPGSEECIPDQVIPAPDQRIESASFGGCRSSTSYAWIFLLLLINLRFHFVRPLGQWFKHKKI